MPQLSGVARVSVGGALAPALDATGNGTTMFLGTGDCSSSARALSVATISSMLLLLRYLQVRAGVPSEHMSGCFDKREMRGTRV